MPARRTSICGHFAPHEALEAELAAFVAPCAGARALTFSTGYLANLAILSALAGRNDAIFADKLNHACLNDGALLARAEFIRYRTATSPRWNGGSPHRPAPRKLIATDAVFSMDGDIAPLATLLELAEAHDAWLVVDDAHGFGVLGEGRGSLAHFGLASERIVYMGTLGKAAGVAGAFVAAHPSVIETLVQTARPYIYTTAQPPLLARGAARCAGDHPRRWRETRSFDAPDRAVSRRRARPAVAIARLGDGDPAAGHRGEQRGDGLSPPRCASADSGCPRSGRRPFRRARRVCACRCRPRTPQTTSHRSSRGVAVRSRR